MTFEINTMKPQTAEHKLNLIQPECCENGEIPKYPNI